MVNHQRLLPLRKVLEMVEKPKVKSVLDRTHLVVRLTIHPLPDNMTQPLQHFAMVLTFPNLTVRMSPTNHSYGYVGYVELFIHGMIVSSNATLIATHNHVHGRKARLDNVG
jgi:hypothetical protein